MMSMFKVLVQIFSSARYSISALFVSLGVYSLMVMLYNWVSFVSIFETSALTTIAKIQLLYALLTGAYAVFGWVGWGMIMAFAVLLSLYIHIFVYWVSYSKKIGKATVATGLGGTVLGFLGLGCAACGTLVIAPFLTFLGAGGLLVLLPLGGLEFLIIAIIWITVSLMVILKKIARPLVCEVQRH